MNRKYYNDQLSRMVYDKIKDMVEPAMVELFPNYELSHMGINRNETTEEVVIKLHLNPFGSVRGTGSEPWQEDYKRLT